MNDQSSGLSFRWHYRAINKKLQMEITQDFEGINPSLKRALLVPPNASTPA